jgi:hypothetical protein
VSVIGGLVAVEAGALTVTRLFVRLGIPRDLGVPGEDT